MPVGPLSNVAAALALYPKLADLVPEVVIMGGGHAIANITPGAEFNIWADPEAAKRVFASGIDITMIGLDVTHKALITDEHTERLRSAGRVGRMVAELLDFYSAFHREAYTDLAGSPMHDPVAVAHVSHPGLVRTLPAFIDVDCGWEQGRGRTNVDYRGRGEHLPNAAVGLDIDAEAFGALIVERIASLG